MVEPIIIGGGRVIAYNADSRDVLRILVERGEYVHAMHSDPPYHLTSIVKRFGKTDAAPAGHGADGAFTRASRGFMGKEWDGGEIAFDPETWRLHLNALLPGGYLTAFASSRGFGRMSVAIEDAGFVQHPMLAWIFGSGMPKATRLKAPDTDHLRYGGQALKPAMEPIFMGQKPMEGNGTKNWLKHGTGPLDIDAARVAVADGERESYGIDGDEGDPSANAACYGQFRRVAYERSAVGRWPSNVVHDGSPEVLAEFAALPDTSRAGARTKGHADYTAGGTDRVYSGGWGGRCRNRVERHFDDAGTPARFFYTAKADSDEERWFLCKVCGTAHPQRALGLHHHDRNDRSHIVAHPTVKPLDLSRWLVRLTAPTRGQTVFDGFAGAGTTGVACLAEGRRAILCERDPDYFRILVERCRHYAGEGVATLQPRAKKPPRHSSAASGCHGGHVMLRISERDGDCLDAGSAAA